MDGDGTGGMGRGRGRRGGFRAVALALVLSLLMSFLGTTVEAAGGWGAPGPADATSPALVDGEDALDSFFLPRPVTLETSRHALAAPPAPPAPDMAPAGRVAVLPSSWRTPFVETVSTPASEAGRTGPRSPTGPPAA